MDDVIIECKDNTISIVIKSITSLNHLFNLLAYSKFDESLVPVRDLSYCEAIKGNYLNPQKIYITNDNNNIFTIINYNNIEYLISQSIRKEGNTENNSIWVNLNKGDFLINKTKDVAKKDLDCARKLLENVDDSSLSKFIDLKPVYYNLSILPDKKYNYVIENDDIALSTRKKMSDEDIRKNGNFDFDIILKDSRENIGYISITSDFEVSYTIKTKYRRKHYATNALKLLIKLLEKREYKMDITLVALNEISERVIENNNGKYEDMVPYMDGHYPMYSIKL